MERVGATVAQLVPMAKCTLLASFYKRCGMDGFQNTSRPLPRYGKKLFLNFFITYLNQEHGYLVIRDDERNTEPAYTNRIANFDAARYLCQWSRLIKSIGNNYPSENTPKPRKIGRFINFDKTSKKEQGLFVYQDPDSGLSFQLPLVAPSTDHIDTCDYLAFPHAPEYLIVRLTNICRF